MMGLLADRKILITGVLSTRSIAYGVARACQREGATLAFTFVNDELKDRVGQDRRRIRTGSGAPVRCHAAMTRSSRCSRR
jgi:enoyl-[acyl-carrier protein] reductase I